MSNEFYKYIANSIKIFFQSRSMLIKPGERFSLRLDSRKMVENVDHALETLTRDMRIQGTFSYGSVYTTYTIKLNELEVIVAAETGNMTDDFLATLRNLRSNMPLLLITDSKLDTITSGTGDLSAVGMPFNAGALIANILQEISSSEMKSSEKTMLSYELERKQRDRFSDKSSLSEYGIFFTELGRGKIEEGDYTDFGLLIDHNLEESGTDERKVKSRLEDNHSQYSMLDYAYRYATFDKLESIYDTALIETLKRLQKKAEDWKRVISYQDALSSIEKRKRRQNNPLVIEDRDIYVYSENRLLYEFKWDDKAFIRNDGETASKRRSKNILIFNPDGMSSVTVEIDCSLSKIQITDLNVRNLEFRMDGRTAFLNITASGCTFASCTLQDKNQRPTKYKFNICVLNLPVSMFGGIIPHYLISAKNIEIQGLNERIVFNESGCRTVSGTALDGENYSLDYQTRLSLDITDDTFDIDRSKISFYLNIGAVTVPFCISSIYKKINVINGIQLMLQKYRSNNDLRYIENGNTIADSTTPYGIEGNLKILLAYEWKMIKNGWLAAHFDQNGSLTEFRITVPDNIREAYLDLSSYLYKNNQVPSLAVYRDGSELSQKAEKYLTAVSIYLNSFKDGQNLTSGANSSLMLGCVIDDRPGKDSLMMSPLQPLNIAYQIALGKEQKISDVTERMASRLSPLYLIPYIHKENPVTREAELCHAVEDSSSPEWRFYASVSEKKYNASRQFVSRLVESKIAEYKQHFRFLFVDMKNQEFRINLINMGDGLEVLIGIMRYYKAEIRDGIENHMKFRISVYRSSRNDSAFCYLSNNRRLQTFIDENIGIIRDQSPEDSMSDNLVTILEENVACFFHEDDDIDYAHLTFYEMTDHDFSRSDEVSAGHALMNCISTGVSMEGLISGTPSVLSNDYYKTGFGTKYADQNSRLIRLASEYNALFSVAYSVTSLDKRSCTVTAVPQAQKVELSRILDQSHWVVFVDPKVDLSYFNDYSTRNNLMIIHYSDQQSSSSSYDDITVTNKSQQYEAIIREQLQKKGVMAGAEDIHKIIDLFNAVNGSWLLHLITARKLYGAADSNFSREKMSILSAVKLCLAFYRHPSITWVPISLEEVLRVSGATGLSSNTGLLSAKNLGFDHGPTCDDLLMIGVQKTGSVPNIFIHPVEVKIGLNEPAVIDKAIKQVRNTYESLLRNIAPEDSVEADYLRNRMARIFLMQLAIVSAGKMKLYHIDDTQNWNRVIDLCRQDLLNDRIHITRSLDSMIGIGTVVSFCSQAGESSLEDDGVSPNVVKIMELPERTGSRYMVDSMDKIISDLKSDNLLKDVRLEEQYHSGDGLSESGDTQNNKESGVQQEPQGPINTHIVSSNEGVLVGTQQKSESNEQGIGEGHRNVENSPGERDGTTSSNSSEDIVTSEEGSQNVASSELPSEAPDQIRIKFGTLVADGRPLIWTPNDTSILFHTNTGIIGTMGTGKTQFTKSIVTQLYRQQSHNVDGKPLGILIFDYKGDYNESKLDFCEAVNPRIYTPYHLPFNPLALVKGRRPRNLLPVHIASGFMDTISRIYNLGPKQEHTLRDCIMRAYKQAGISVNNESTWDKPAPTFEAVYQIYANDNQIKKNDSLASVMDTLHDFQIFESDSSKSESLYDLLNGVVVISLDGYDENIKTLVVAIILDQFYLQMQAFGSSSIKGDLRQLTKFVLVDEADNFMSRGFPSLKKILKEGREFGVGTILSTQYLTHFGNGEDDYSKYILTWVVHKVPDLTLSDVDFVFNTQPKSELEQKLFNDIKVLDKHHSIVNIGDGQPLYLEDLPFWKIRNDSDVSAQ